MRCMKFQSLILHDSTNSTPPAFACKGDKVVGLESVIDAVIESFLEILHVIVRREVCPDIPLLIYLVSGIQKLIYDIPYIRPVGLL